MSRKPAPNRRERGSRRAVGSKSSGTRRQKWPHPGSENWISTDTDLDAITQTGLDHVEHFYAGDAERVERAPRAEET